MRVDVAELARRATNRRRKNVILPAIETTYAQEQELARLYLAVIKAWMRAIRFYVMPAYTASIAEAKQLRLDNAVDIATAIDVAESRAVTATLNFTPDFTQWAERVNMWHLRRTVSSIKYAANVDLETMIAAGDTRMTIEASLARNTSLIRNVSDDVRNRIADIVFRGYQARTPVRDIAREIAEAADMVRKRARRIASDQTVKLAASLDRERHAQLGITKFLWRHSGKVHYRPEHLARDNKVFEWDSPVGTQDPPGWLPFCGCKAQAVIEVAEPVPVARLEPTIAELNARQDAAMRAYVLERGKATNSEHLTAYDTTTGKPVMAPRGDGNVRHVTFGPELLAAMSDKTRSVVAHHNHPSGNSFSPDDMAALSYYPGLKGLWAHGHDGTAYFAEILIPFDTRAIIENGISAELKKFVQDLYYAKGISFEAATASHWHLVSMVLRDIGAIRYTATEAPAAKTALWDEAVAATAELRAKLVKRYGQMMKERPFHSPLYDAAPAGAPRSLIDPPDWWSSRIEWEVFKREMEESDQSDPAVIHGLELARAALSLQRT